MKAMRIHQFGGPEVLELDEIEIPHPHDDEVLVRVYAASLNPVDYKTREGHYPVVPESKLPVTLGRDVAGVVELRGAAVREFDDGAPVFALLPPDRGGYAEFVAIKATDAVAMPRSLNFFAAASVPLAALTAWQGLFDHGKLQSGERVLIHGGAGGVGHFAIQFAKARGCTVYTTVSARDIAFARDMGADLAIDYASERFEDGARDVDLVLDLVNGDTQKRSFSVLKRGGRLVSTLAQPDATLCAERGIEGSHYMATVNTGELRQIAGLIDERKVRPIVSGRLPFTDARMGQELLAHQHPFGKLVLEMAA